MAQQYYRIIEKHGGAVIVDVDGNILSPEQARKLGQELIRTADNRAYVYFGLRSDGLYKIGRTNNLDRRMPELKVVDEYAHTIECDLYGEYSASMIETEIHHLFQEKRTEGEWFKLTVYDTALIQEFCNTAKETLEFLDRYYEVIAEIDELSQKRSTPMAAIQLLAEAIDGQHNQFFNRVFVYILHNWLAVLREKDTDEYGIGLLTGLLKLLDEINKSRTARAEARRISQQAFQEQMAKKQAEFSAKLQNRKLQSPRE